MTHLRRKEESGPPKISFEIRDSDPPAFSLRYLQHDFCVTDCSKDQRAAFATKLRELSQLSWSKLRQSPRHGLGYERIPRDAIKAPVPNHVTEEVHLIAFRFDGLRPMVGYRDSGIFFILWLDRNFTLYSH
jgi:hypothetical protein